jgi:tungstate transport system permease protein
MTDLAEAFRAAFGLIVSRDPDLLEIVALSLRVSLVALVPSTLVGVPLGAAVAIARFPGRRLAVALLNLGMALPPVVVGLLVYLVLSRSGPLGPLELLFTPTALIVGQTVLVTPLVAALSRQVFEDHWVEYEETLRSLGARRGRAVATLIYEARHSLVTVLLAGFGRAITEVGVAIIVGGNVNHLTRIMTTAIALETSRGDLPLALGLGFVLLAISLGVNALALVAQEAVRRAEA